MIVFLIYAIVYLIIGDMIWKWIEFVMERAPFLHNELEDKDISMTTFKNVVVFLWPLVIIVGIYTIIKERNK